MVKTDVIIVGAGASGLMAAKELTGAGTKILLLEAGNRIGGRIHTSKFPGFSKPVEAGAEFIHGNLHLTKTLLKEANIPAIEFSGNSYQVKKGEILTDINFISNPSLFFSKLNSITEDMTLLDFFNIYLNEEKYKDIRETVKRFAQGYDAAEIDRLSTLSLKAELMNMERSDQYIPANGYSSITDYLAEKISVAGRNIKLSNIVKEIQWKKGKVKVINEEKEEFFADKVIITVPVGVLQANPEAETYIHFSPELPGIREALKAFGFGGVIKFLFEFKEKFWEKEKFQDKKFRQMPGLSFLFSDAPVPVWWTQPQKKEALITGWLGGPDAKKICDMKDKDILQKGLNSLSYIFDLPASFLNEELVSRKIFNWIKDPYSRGAYSFATIHSNTAREFINKPIENTLYFAGEAFDKNETIGTVEAALASGLSAAKRVLTH